MPALDSQAPATSPDLWLAVLGSLYRTYYVAHQAHWNVTGLDFVGLHDFFGDAYESWHDEVDTVAEHIRSLPGDAAIPDLEALLETAASQPGLTKEPVALLSAYEAALAELDSAVTAAYKEAEASEDFAGLDLSGSLLRDIKKAKWQTKALLNDPGIKAGAPESSEAGLPDNESVASFAGRAKQTSFQQSGSINRASSVHAASAALRGSKMNSKHIDKIVAVAKSLHSRGITSVIDTTAGVLYAVNPEAKSATAATHETTEAPKTGKADESGKVSTILPKRIEFRDGEYVSIYAGKIVKAKKAIEGLREDAKKSPEAKLRWGGEVDGGVFVKTGDIVTLTRKEITEKVKEMKAAGKAKAEKDEKKATASAEGKRIRTSYEVWDEDALEAGDTDDRGWEDEEGEVFEDDVDGETAVESAISWLRDKGATEASCSRFEPRCWYISTDTDFRTGDVTNYHYHLNDGWTDEEKEEIFNAVTGKRRATASASTKPTSRPIPSDLRGKGLGKPRAEGVAPRQVSDKVAKAPSVAKSAPKTAPALPKQVKQPVFKEARENGEGEIEVVVPKAKLATRDIGAGARKPKFD